MNQKQKDLLCKMLNGKAEELKKQLSDQLPLINKWRCGIGKYDIKHCSVDDEIVDYAPTATQKKLRSLQRRRDKIEEQEKALDKEWEAVAEEMNAMRSAQDKKKHSAITKLSKAVESAVVDIQFAADAEATKGILSSLPTVEELLK
jgi:DNA repair exonuclease SbcCD ATPase subunit